MIRRRWRAILVTSLILISATSIVAAVYQARHNSTWAAQLHDRGNVVEAVVYDVGGFKNKAMYVRFDYAGRSYHAKVYCSGPCDSPGETIHVWVNSADPTDLATEDGTLSGNRTDYPYLLGFGGLIVLIITVGAAAGYRRVVREKAALARRASQSTRPKQRTRPPRNHRHGGPPSVDDQ